MEVVPQGCHEPQLTRLKPLAWPERSRPADPHHRCCTWLSSVRESTNGRDFVKLNVSLRTLEYVQPSPKRRASCVEHGSLSLFDTHPVYFFTLFHLFLRTPRPRYATIVILGNMDLLINNKQSNQRIVRHAEYYIHGGDIIFRVRGSHGQHCADSQ